MPVKLTALPSREPVPIRTSPVTTPIQYSK